MKYLGILYFILILNLSSFSEIEVNECYRNVLWYEEEIYNYHKRGLSYFSGNIFKLGNNSELNEQRKISAYKRIISMEKSLPSIEKKYINAKKTRKQINDLFFISVLFFIVSVIIRKYVKFNFLFESYQLFFFSIGIISLIFIEDVIIENYFLKTQYHILRYPTQRTNIALEFLAIIPLYLSKYYSNKYFLVTEKGLVWKKILKICFILYLVFLSTFGLLQWMFSGPWDWLTLNN
jgi:hypothetical protein